MDFDENYLDQLITNAVDLKHFLTGALLLERRNYGEPLTFRSASYLALNLRKLWRFREAEELLLKALASDCKDGEKIVLVYSNLGKLYSTAGRFAEAELYLRKAIDVNPNMSVPIVYLYEILARSGRWQDARSVIHTAFAVGEDLDEMHMNMGLILRALGDYESAFRHFEQGLEIEPNNPWARLALNDLQTAKSLGLWGGVIGSKGAPGGKDVLEEMAQKSAVNKEWLTCVMLLEELLIIETYDLHVRYFLGCALIRIGRYCMANELLSDVLGSNILTERENSKILLDLGYIAAVTGRPSEAVDLFRKAIWKDPSYTGPHVLLSIVLAWSGKSVASIKHLTTACQLDGDLAEVEFFLGVMEMSEKQYELSEKHLRCVLTMKETPPTSNRRFEDLTTGRVNTLQRVVFESDSLSDYEFDARLLLADLQNAKELGLL